MGVHLPKRPLDPFRRDGTIVARIKRNRGFKRKGQLFMRLNLRHGVWVLAVAVGIGINGLTLQAAGAPFFQDHDQDHAQNQDKDYSKNKTYQQGMREGKDDQAHNRDHSKKRHFKKDEDQKAYEAGYQKGHTK
jgi:hypothetical protein